ncbi:SMR family transporter [Pseudomonas sp.]|uniref:SMR family transporter n=1 Tax=Pseudomonas sp. TaxID=306 RepID=UPI0019ED466B|nr:SMR family transporter [Pseudomonas sp.]MBF0675246.1 EamA family transporter [Pseudomonas sp.]
MSPLSITLLIMAIIANALASILLKKFSTQGDASHLSMSTLLHLGGSVFFYGLAFLVYAALLKTLPVSKAYTLMTFGAQTALIVCGIFFFDEKYSTTAWIGLGLVVVGLLLVSKGALQ